MKAFQLQGFFLTIFLTSSIQSKLSPDSKNVCLYSETYEETIMVPVRKPVKEFKKRKCWKMMIKFSCTKEVTTWKMVQEPRVVQKSRDVLKCCSGYRESGEEVTECVPSCPAGCVHGECTAPDQCTCMSGFQGRACDQRLDETAAATNPTAETISLAEEIFHATEKSKSENSNLILESLLITNADFVSDTSDESTKSTKEATFAIEDETSNEVDGEETSRGETERAEEVELNKTASMMASTEELRMDVNYNNLMEEETGLRKGVSNSLKKLSSEGSEVSTEEHTEEPTEISSKNFWLYDFTSVLYLLIFSGIVLAIASWNIAKYRKKTKKSHAKKQRPLRSNKPVQFSMKKLLWNKPLGSSESTSSMWEAEPKTLRSVTSEL